MNESPETFSACDDRIAADVFELTYREFAALKPAHYRWRVIVPEAVRHLRRAEAEHWSLEKLADHLHTHSDEAALRLRRYVMSERVNAQEEGAERIRVLFREWLERFEPDLHQRKVLARDLGRLVSSQLHYAAERGETLGRVAAGLEDAEANPPSDGDAAGEKPAWGPQWKD